VIQRNFILGVRSLNEQDLHDNLAYFQVPPGGIESIRSKLAFKIWDEYANILKGVYSMRLNGRPRDNDVHDQTDSVPGGPMFPLFPLIVTLITSLQVWHPNNIRIHKEKEKKGVG